MNPMKTDLQMSRRAVNWTSSSREAVGLEMTLGDLKLSQGLDNLAQAIQNRLLTRKGELSHLGHPDYGSELYLLSGEPQSWKTKALAEMYIREALQREKRIEEVEEITFADNRSSIEARNTMAITIRLKPVEAGSMQLSLNLSL